MTGPRRKHMKRSHRLSAAIPWTSRYEGKNLVAGYSKWFGVDQLCAIKELTMIGVDIPPQIVAQVQSTHARKHERALRNKEKKKQNSMHGMLSGHDEFFAFIAGFTEGGAAYGITWEEWEAMENSDDQSTRYSDEAFVKLDDSQFSEDDSPF